MQADRSICRTWLALGSLLILTLGAGCALFRNPSVGYLPEWHRRVANLTFADIPLPAATPYDLTNALRLAYFKGYRQGVAFEKGNPDNGLVGILFSTTTAVEEAECHGWKAGRFAASQKIEEIRSQLKDESILAYSNRHQSAWFLPSGRLFALRTDAVDRHGIPRGSTFTEWYDTGTKMHVVKTDAKGIPVGTETYWHTNGRVWNVKNWADGELEGPDEANYLNGQRLYRLNWRRSKPVGKARVWNERGKLIAKGCFLDGLWHETYLMPGYTLEAPALQRDQTEESCTWYSTGFGITIDPKGPAVTEYREFLLKAEGETNTLAELTLDDDEMTAYCEGRPGRFYKLEPDRKSWTITERGFWTVDGVGRQLEPVQSFTR